MVSPAGAVVVGATVLVGGEVVVAPAADGDEERAGGEGAGGEAMSGHGSSWDGRVHCGPWRTGVGPGRPSAEVAAPGGSVEVEGPELLGDHVHHPLGALQATSDQQGGGRGGHPAVAGPAPLGDDHVDQAGLVLQVHEDGAARGGRALAVGHHPGHQDLGRVLGVGGRVGRQAGGGDDPDAVQLGPDEPGGVPVGADAGGPQVRRGLLGRAHPRQARGLGPGDDPGQAVGAGLGDGTDRPEGGPAVGAEAVEGACGGQGLQRREPGPGAPGQVLGIGVGTAVGDGLGQVVAHPSDRSDAQAHRRAALAPQLRRGAGVVPGAGDVDAVQLQGGQGVRGVDVGAAHHDPVAAGVAHQGVGRVEAHGLGVEEPDAEGRRVVALEPGRGVDQVGEADRVALGEAVAGEGGQLLPQLLGDLVG